MMKKILSIAMLAIFTSGVSTDVMAAFPVKTVKSQQTGKTVEKIKIEKVNLSTESNEVAVTAAASGGKSQVAAALLAFFLGELGIHNFYLGNTSKGFMQLGGFLLGLALVIAGAATAVAGSTSVLFWVGLFLIIGISIWAFIDFIRILIGSYLGL